MSTETQNSKQSDSAVLQNVLSLTNEFVAKAISQTTYATKLSTDEKEKLSRELTASIVNMLLSKFSGKPL